MTFRLTRCLAIAVMLITYSFGTFAVSGLSATTAMARGSGRWRRQAVAGRRRVGQGAVSAMAVVSVAAAALSGADG